MKIFTQIIKITSVAILYLLARPKFGLTLERVLWLAKDKMLTEHFLHLGCVLFSWRTEATEAETKTKRKLSLISFHLRFHCVYAFANQFSWWNKKSYAPLILLLCFCSFCCPWKQSFKCIYQLWVFVCLKCPYPSNGDGSNVKVYISVVGFYM